MKRLKYFTRKFRYNRKRSTLVYVLVLLCLFLTLGFAYLTTELNISGIANISSSRWDIHFENIEIEEGSVEATTEPTISNDTTISFSATLSNPGDFYKFTTDVVNDGTYDAKIDSITLSPTLTSDEEEYFEYKIEYTEGGNIQVDDALDAGTSENITVLFKYKTNADSSVYPEEDKDFTVEVTITYVQGKGNEVHHTSLYSVLKDAAIEGTYAKEYTGEHHDSFTKEPTKKIYHWYAPNTDEGDNLALEIQDKQNVLFAGFCWQIYRTTDTGGVKMMYNGVANDGKCNNTVSNHQIGTSAFNSNHDSLSDVGYMYNDHYPNNEIRFLKEIQLIESYTMTRTANYYYGTGVTYNSSTNQYTLTGTTQNQWSNQYSTASGLYTCRNTTGSPCSTVYYITGGIAKLMYGIAMSNGNLLDYYDTDIVFGTSYTENNGIYTLQNTSTVKISEWYNDYDNYKNKYTCGNSSISCENMRFTYSNYFLGYSYLELQEDYVYANSFTYNPTTSTYTLDATNRVQFWNFSDSTNQNSLNNNHYTCFNTTGECTTVAYIHEGYFKSIISLDYIYLSNGKSVEDALDSMLFNDNVNSNNSEIKAYVDNWYQNNMLDYSNYLEDSIYCNDRSVKKIGPFNPNGGKLTDSLDFNARDTTSLKCINETDSFSINNNKAKLLYPVGIITFVEANTIKNPNILFSEEDYWMISPGYSIETPVIRSYTNSDYGGPSINSEMIPESELGVRPVISLKPGTHYSSGNGSKESPYIIE